MCGGIVSLMAAKVPALEANATVAVGPNVCAHAIETNHTLEIKTRTANDTAPPKTSA